MNTQNSMPAAQTALHATGGGAQIRPEVRRQKGPSVLTRARRSAGVLTRHLPAPGETGPGDADERAVPSSTAVLSPRSGGLIRGVPYVRGRLVFAVMAARALQELACETVLIDLPCCMNQPRWLNPPLEAFPLVSSILLRGGDGSCTLYPVVPTDAAFAAAWLAKRSSRSLECVGPEIPVGHTRDIHAIPPPPPGNERLAWTQGPEAYFEGAWLGLESSWRRGPDVSMRMLLARGETVAGRIRQKLAAGLELLFVCEYRLWWAVRRALEHPSAVPAGTSGEAGDDCTCPGALLLEDPYLLWAAGMFDDYLTINREFHASLEAGTAVSFDKFARLADLVAGCRCRDLKSDAGPDLQDILSRYARRLRDKTDPGPAAPDKVARLLHDYPVPTSADVAEHPPEYFKTAGSHIVSNDKSFDLPDVFHAYPYGEPSRFQAIQGFPTGENPDLAPWLRYVRPVLTRQEAKELGVKTSSSRWAVARDFELHMRACSLVCQAAAERESAVLGSEALGEYTPVMFLFRGYSEEISKYTLVHNGSLPYREEELRRRELEPAVREAGRDYVYSLFATTRKLELLFEDHIEREFITSLTLLFSGKGMGVQRYAAIIQQPRKYQCRLGPREDPDLRIFRSIDIGLAWAVKYARKTVLAVAAPGWEPPQDVENFAHRQSKRILTVPLAVLPDDLTERISRLHFISNALKAHPECERIIARFVP